MDDECSRHKCMLAYLGGCDLSQGPVLGMQVLSLLNLVLILSAMVSTVTWPTLHIS